MRPSMLTAALLVVLGQASALHGQRPASIGLAGGASLPQGRFGDGVDVGWHALGALALGHPVHPLGIRLDAAYSQFAFAAAATGGSQRTISLSANPTYRLPSAGWPLAPYVIGGAGAYRLGCTGDAACGESTRFGWNAGLGTRFIGLGLRAFVEARYHRVGLPGGDVHYVPVTLGLTF